MMMPTGKPLFLGMSFAVALIALAATGACAAVDFPIASRGDIWFQADHAAFRTAEGQAIEEYYFRISNNQLKFDEKDGRFEGRVFIKLRFRDEEEHQIGEAGHQYGFVVSSTEVAASASHAQLLLLQEPLDPRARFVEIEVEDLNARKRGLLYMVTGKRKNGEATGILPPAPFVNQEFSTSDIQFAWEVRTRTADSSFEKNGFDVIPNPARSYGLLQPRLSGYVEVYDHRPDREGRVTYQVLREMLDPAGAVVRSSQDTVGSSSPEWVDVFSFDVSNLPTGQYTMRLAVVDLNQDAQVTTVRPFSILWRNQFWAQTEEDVANQAKVLFVEEEYLQFMQMSAGEREVHLEQFWASIDPTPDTATNEIRSEFMSRVDYANRHYTANRKRGMLTDRGRIYIRYGLPDEIDRELLPTGSSQLDGQVDDLAEVNDAGQLLATADGFDTRPFEVWIYMRQGEPLFPEREVSVTTTGLRFVFVDETGTGDYRIRYQSDFIGY